MLRPAEKEGCQPFWPTPNRTKALDLAFLKAHSRPTQGSLVLTSPAVIQYFQSRDPRNFAVEVSVEEYGVAFGLPSSDAQNHFYRMSPARRVILVFSYGTFQWQLTGDFAAQTVPDFISYSVGMVGLDAHDGTVLTGEMPVCK
jgi:hypothetical protein